MISVPSLVSIELSHFCLLGGIPSADAAQLLLSEIAHIDASLDTSSETFSRHWGESAARGEVFQIDATIGSTLLATAVCIDGINYDGVPTLFIDLIAAKNKRQGLGSAVMEHIEQLARDRRIAIVMAQPIDDCAADFFAAKGYDWDDGHCVVKYIKY